MASVIVSEAPAVAAGEVYAVPLLGHVGWTLLQVTDVRPDSLRRMTAHLALLDVLYANDVPDAETLGDELPAPFGIDRVPERQPRDWRLIGRWPPVEAAASLPRIGTAGRFFHRPTVPPPATAEHPFISWSVERRDDPDEAEYPYLCHAPYDLVDWDRRLAATSEMLMDGDEHGLPWILEHHPWVTRLIWRNHRHEVIDLSRTALGSIDLELTPGLEFVKLPPTIGSVTVRVSDPEHLPRFEVEGGLLGGYLEIVGSPLVALEGFEDVARLVVSQTGRPLDVATVRQYRAVETFQVGRPSGSLECLTAWPRLRTLDILGAIDVDPERVPRFSEWDQMDRMSIVELSRPSFERFCERLDDAYHLEFARIRSQKWLDQQRDNPFRNWDSRGPDVGRRGMSLWKRVRKLDEAGEPREAVRSLVRGLNRMARDLHVESAERDDAFRYAREIGDRHGIEQRMIAEWFDEGRDF